MPSLVHALTNTTATLEDCASAAAEAGFAPWSNCRLAPGALARIAARGEDGSKTWDALRQPAPLDPAEAGGHTGGRVSAAPPVGATCAEPPPETTPTSACDPMTAIEPIFDASRGSWPAEFFSSTAPCSRASWAAAAPAAASSGPGTDGWSKSPAARMARRIRCTMLSRRDMGICPLWIALARLGAQTPPNRYPPICS